MNASLISNGFVLAAGAPSGDGGAALRVLVGLGVLVTLALLASSKLLWSYRRGPIGAMISAGGWGPVLIGLALGPGAVGLVTEMHVDVLTPLILFCLGWVGLMIGLQLRADLPRLLPAGAGRWAALDVVISMVLFGTIALGTLQWVTGGEPLAPLIVVAAVLGVCGIGWSPEVRSVGGGQAKLAGAAQLLRATSSLAGVYAVCIFGVMFMSGGHGRQMSTASMMLVIGVIAALLIAAVSGWMARWLVAVAGRSDSAFLVVLLGLVAFAAGVAAMLGFSPLFVAMLLGAVIVNFPGTVFQRFQRVIVDAEQPIAMALMLTAGVIADPWLGRTAALLIAAVLVGRLLGKRLVARWQPYRVAGAKGTPMVFGPIRQAPLAIALALDYAVSGRSSLTESVLSGGELVMVVIIVGLICDAIPIITRFTHPGRWAKANAATDDTTQAGDADAPTVQGGATA